MAKVSETPEQVVAQLTAHVARYPEDSRVFEKNWLPGQEWRKRYRDLLCRWVEAIYAVPEAAKEFERLASLPISEEATELFGKVEIALLAACNATEPVVTKLEARGGRWSAPYLLQNELPSVSLAGCPCEIRQACNQRRHALSVEEIQGSPTRRLVRLTPDISPSPDIVGRDLDRCKGLLSRLREWNTEVLGLVEDEAFAAAERDADRALAELDKLLFHGRLAELWAPSYSLIENYFAYDPTPKPSIGASIPGDWRLVGYNLRILDDFAIQRDPSKDAAQQMAQAVERLTANLIKKLLPRASEARLSRRRATQKAESPFGLSPQHLVR